MIKHLLFVFGLLLLSTITCLAQYGTPEDARNFLLQDVDKVAKPGVPGPFILLGESAFPVMIGSVGGDIEAPFVAGSFMGQGAVIAFGHGGYLEGQSVYDFNTPQLIENAARWTSGLKKPKILIHKNKELFEYLAKRGYDIEESIGTLEKEYLAKFDVLITISDNLTWDEVDNVKAFIKSGKGLVTAGLGWGWMQLNPTKSLDEMPGNVLLEESGIAWAPGYLEDDFLVAQTNISPYFNFEKAYKFVSSETMSTINRKTYGQALSVVLQTLPFLKNAKDYRFTIVNSFPGMVSNQTTAVSKTITVDTKIPLWHSTGLYAAPGNEIIIEIPEKLRAKGYHVRIGAHVDRCYHHDEWLRHPEVTIRYPLNNARNSVFNPFGGLIYIEVPQNQTLGEADIKITGAVQAPRFVLGQTSLKDWMTTIRNYPAPWAELEGEELIITLQSEKIRDLERPDDIIEFWDQAQKNNRELAYWPKGKLRPMRIVFDKQISAGYMHSGYPVMSQITGYNEQESILDKNSDHWGFYHELGHNHQHSDWTFENTVEVTCNLFTLYNIEFLQGKKRKIGDDELEWKYIVNAYFNEGSPYEKWEGNAFLALHMYNQLINEYGWQTLKNIIRKYTELAEKDRPNTNTEKIDLWFTMYCFETGENLTNFFDKWGLPISFDAKRKVQHLPGANLDRLLANMQIDEVPRTLEVIERFRYDGGFFVKRTVGSKTEWVEQKPTGEDSFFFTEYGEDDDYFYIRKNGTNMNIRVPKSLGWLQFGYEGDDKWNNLYRINPF